MQQKLLIFLKSPQWPVWIVWTRGLLKGYILSSIICALKCTAIFKEHLSLAAAAADQANLNSLKFLL